MSPTSLRYLLLLAAAAAVHWRLPARWKNLFLLGVSWCFYLVCAPELFPVLALSTVLNYYLAFLIRGRRGSRWPAAAGICFNIGVLFLFKYLRFAGYLLSLLLTRAGLPALSLPAFVQPLGLSFYTFAVTGYLIDVYRGRRPERSFRDFALFVSFFPAILAGPIPRGDRLLPRLKAHGRPGAAVSREDVCQGVTRILTGLCKKLLLADQLAAAVNTVYAAPEQFSGPQVLWAAFAYSFQIYCDFSAYSDLAVGAGRLFGLRLTENFDAPYLASSVRDFWRRWHISLSTWFRDYLYFPLGGSRRGKARTCWNLLVVFAVSGLWHGAAMTFVLWGCLHGLFQVAELLLSRSRAKGKTLPASPGAACFGLVRTFLLCTAAWVFFRADSVGHALRIFRGMAAGGSLFPLDAMGLSPARWAVLGLGLLLLLALDLLRDPDRLPAVLTERPWLRWGVWCGMVLAVLLFGAYGTGYDPQEFVYFRF